MRYNYAALFDRIAGALPEHESVVFRQRRLTYRQLRERVHRLANLLLAHGITIHRPRSALSAWESGQDHVALYLHNGNEYIEGMLGAAAARAASVNVNYRYVAGELTALLDDAGAAAVVYHARFAPTLAAVLGRLRRAPLLLQVDDGSGHALLPGALDYEQALAAAPDHPPPTDPDPDDLYILYTGGTTGLPKGTLWAQAELVAAAIAGFLPDGLLDAADYAEAVRLVAAAPRRVVLPLPPLMHGGGQWLALSGLLSGGTVVFPDVVERLDPAAVWRVVDRERVQLMNIVGNVYADRLCDELAGGGYSGASLELLGVGGAVTSAANKDRILSLLPHLTIVDGAGSSESGTNLFTFTTADAPATSGAFAPTPDTCVVDDAKAAVLRPGDPAIGWLARHTRIPLGYLGDPARTAATFPVIDGTRYVLPGDRARHRADGTIELLGRDAVTINSGGEKIFAEEVEDALLAHPGVRDVVVVGRPSRQWGEEVVAVVQLAAGHDPPDRELLAVAARTLARYKLPKAVLRVPAVVRGPAGKADYPWARQLAASAAPPPRGES